MVCCVRCSKRFKICCFATSILLVILLLILVLVLFFTVFKVKDPDIILQSVKLEDFKLGFPDFKLNLSLGIVVTVENPNLGSFTYQNSTAYLHYRGTVVAEAPLHEGTIPAHDDHNLTISLTIFADVINLKDFASDYLMGAVNFTSTATLLGKVKVLKLFKMKATSYSTCDHSLSVRDKNVSSACNSEIKL